MSSLYLPSSQQEQQKYNEEQHDSCSRVEVIDLRYHMSVHFIFEALMSEVLVNQLPLADVLSVDCSLKPIAAVSQTEPRTKQVESIHRGRKGHAHK